MRRAIGFLAGCCEDLSRRCAGATEKSPARARRSCRSRVAVELGKLSAARARHGVEVAAATMTLDLEVAAATRRIPGARTISSPSGTDQQHITSVPARRGVRRSPQI